AVGLPHGPDERGAGVQTVTRDDRRSRTEPETVDRLRGRRERGIAVAVDAVLVRAEVSGLRDRTRTAVHDVDVSTVAGPRRGRAPHAAERTEARERRVTRARTVAVAAEVVAVEQVHVPGLALLQHQVRMARRAEE